MSGYPLIIFDWDGTLMDSKDRITECMQAAIRDVGAAPRSAAEIHNIIGLGLHESMQTLFPDNPEIWTAVIAAYRDHFLDEQRVDSEMFAGVDELLRELHARGRLLAVATSKARRGLDRVLGQTGLGAYFHATRCADEARSKPHPDMLQHILAVLGHDAEDAVMVGDTEYDLRMAQAIGMDSIAVTYGVHERQRLLACQPRHCVDDVASLATILLGE